MIRMGDEFLQTQDGNANPYNIDDATTWLDWSKPTGATIHLALIRHQATDGHPLGSLLVNPGGPGGSGFNFVKDSLTFAVDKTLDSIFPGLIETDTVDVLQNVHSGRRLADLEHGAVHKISRT